MPLPSPSFPRKALLAVLATLGLVGAVVLGGWYAPGPLVHDTTIVVPQGATLASMAPRLTRAGAIGGSLLFRLRARLLTPGAALKAGAFVLPAGASEARIVAILSGHAALHRFITVPEGLPAVLVSQRLRAEAGLTGEVATPEEGSVLPETYDFRDNEPRAAVLARMQAAMTRTLAQLWAERAPNLPITTPREALILASIVEKETGKPEERARVAGLYENRLRQGMMLQADPTIIYPITQGRPLGRRIRQSEIAAVNDYNTYAMVGLPKAPITNPGKASIAAVLHPASTNALYMVADGSGGHVFADTLAEHNRNVARWFTIRRARGDL